MNPNVAHMIDARVILGHTVRLDQTHLSEVRREFARYLTAAQVRNRHENWQQAWNAWTGATPYQAGRIRFHTSRCPECKGRGFSHRNISRNLSRTGNPHACAECRGNGSGKWLTITATYIAPPATDPATDSATGEA